MTDQELIVNLSHADKIYAIFCNFTHMPYVECDEETYSDKAFLFFDEEKAKEFALTYKGGKQSLAAVKVEQNLATRFLASLIAEGFDMLSVHDEEVHLLPIDQLITRTLQEGAKKPIENPALQLSMMYFLQQIQIAQTEEEKEEVRSREEEMMANIARAVYLVPFTEMEGETDNDSERKVSITHLMNEAGDAFIPLFTDIDEFVKIRPKEGTTNFLPMSFQKIRDIKRDDNVIFIINPGSVHLQLNQHNLEAVDNRFGDQSK